MGKMKLKKPRLKKVPLPPPPPGFFKYTYSGNLATYYETGYEGMSAAILEDNRGDHEGPHHDKDKAAAGEMFTYKSLEWAHFFDKHAVQHLQVFDPEGKEIYNGPISMDRHKVAAFDYRLSFIPREVDTKEWVVWLTKEYKAVIQTDRPALVDDEKYQAEQKAFKEKWAKKKAEDEAKAEQK